MKMFFDILHALINSTNKEDQAYGIVGAALMVFGVYVFMLFVGFVAAFTFLEVSS